MADLNVKVYSMFWGFFAIFTLKKRVASVKEKSAKNKKNILIYILRLVWALTVEYILNRVRTVLENLESPGEIESQNPGLENLENRSQPLKVLENQDILWAFFMKKF